MEHYAIETEGLTKTFVGFAAVKNVALKVRSGALHALIGPNGAGKTTVFNLLTKFHLPSAGRILIDGRDVTALKPSAISRRGVARSFQISSVFPHLSVHENVRVALQRKLGTGYEFWRSNKTLRVLDERAMELLADVGLTAYAGHAAADLAYGRKRALELATTLALDPSVLLLDEPMAGLGVEDIERITALIRSAAVGRTVLMVEHNLRVVADLCDRITVLQRGQILTEGTYREVSANPAVIEAYMGNGHV
ncbi:ABC transporter ATP-binding protein [Corticibacterium sp. UT-5YL-CI-8]|nr:ABC transporter ATP-binding protein [Tianweitania sp. UT-5YL-CI-8]